MALPVIVLVEDNAAIAWLIQEVLNNVPGFGAGTVGDGALALEVIAAVHADRVILDIDLPGINGFEVYDLLQSRPDIKTPAILFMSAVHHEDELRRRRIEWHLLKPFDLDDLLDHAHTLLGPAG